MTRTSRRRSMALAGVALAAPLLIGGCSKKDDAATSASSTTAPPATLVNQGPTIVINKRSFTPTDSTAKVGEIVTWSNEEEGIAHAVTEDKPEGEQLIKSPNLETGKAYTVTFANPGTYSFFCSIHPNTMKGSIEITA